MLDKFDDKYYQNLIQNISNVHNKLNQTIHNLKNELSLLEKDYKIVDQIFLALKEERYAQILEIWKKDSATITNIGNSNNLSEIFLEINNLAKQKCQEIVKKYPVLLEEACKKENINIDETSRHPKYTFCGNFITLEIDEKNYRANAYTSFGNLFRTPLDLSLVIPQLKKEIDRIFNRPFNPNEFIKNIYEYYREILKEEDKKPEEYITIRKITEKIKKKKNNYRMDEFVVDLSKFMKDQNDYGFKINIQHTKNYNSGILIYGFEHHGYIERISITKKENL